MKIENCKLSKIKPNKANPRVIKDNKFHLLVKSILVLPKMLELRPIVVNSEMVVLGGNMRLRALEHISGLTEAERLQIMQESNDYNLKPTEQRVALVEYWNKFQDNKIVPFIKADEMTDTEQREFIVKDNVAFGKWDWDALANEWDAEELPEWGVDFPIMESEINTDEFFDSLDNDDEKSKSEKIVISIPEDMKDLKEEMKALVEDALKEYSGIKVK